jgi:glycosyltransferase involved in cell wall biosynthesis
MGGDLVVRIAVVVPLYKQAQFLAESVTSALCQSVDETCVVIVNDGCPDPQSHQLGIAFAAAHPDRVGYLRQHNCGLSAARNRGVDYALDRWSEVEALFFLDADNFLDTAALETMYSRLNDVNKVDWVYASPERFGEDQQVWRSASPANLYYMLFENQSDAGSLIRRTVFDAGIYFDETMRRGYEDWEFFIRALRAGYSGASAGKCGFHYRVRNHSMLIESQRSHDILISDIHERHHDLLEPHRLTAIEHAHCPRFLWVDPDGKDFAFTDPEITSLRSLAALQDGYWPPVLLIGSSDVFSLLSKRKILRSVLLCSQPWTLRSPMSFTVRTGSGKWHMARQAKSDDMHIVAMRGDYFKHPKSDSFDPIWKRFEKRMSRFKNCVIQVPGDVREFPLVPINAASLRRTMMRMDRSGLFDSPEPTGPTDNVQPPTRLFSWNRNCRELDTTHPFVGEGRLHIGFAVPWLGLGGVDLCVIQLARAIRRILPEARLSVVSTQGGIACGEPQADIFDEIILLEALDYEHRIRLCEVVLQSLDLVINAHSMTAYDSLRLRQKRPAKDRSGSHISYLHVIDQGGANLVGYPFLAAQLEHAIDGFAVISETLRSFLINQGVSPFRIRIVRNAPVVTPDSFAASCALAKLKADRLVRGERPLRLLFAGRADYQKGLSRLKHLTDLLAAKRVPFQLTFVGGSVLKAEPVEWSAEHVRTLPATHDQKVLASYYAESDVCVLLSRWEGVPLTLLDAMAHGCVVVATDVGAVAELVENTKNGFLLADASDVEVATEAAEVIQSILRDDTGNALMRQAAVTTAWAHSWDTAARSILEFLPKQIMRKHGLQGG